MGKQKINELDFLRAAAFLSVVMQHVLGVYLGNDVYRWESAGVSVLFFASKFAVPCFVFVSGLVLFYNYYDGLKYGSFLIKRIKEIIIPYLIWTAFYVLYYRTSGNLSGVVNAVVLGKGAYHLWYVVMIFQFYLFLPVYIAVFKFTGRLVKSNKGRAVIIGAFTLLYMIYILLPSYLTPKGLFRPQNPVIRLLFVDYVTRNSISYIFYFVMGALIGLNLEKFRTLARRFTAILAGAFVLGFAFLELIYYKYGFINGKISVNYPSFFKPPYFLFTVLCILFLYRVALSRRLIKGWLSQVFAFVSKHSYQAYLAHAFTLNTLAFMLYKTGITFRPLIYGLVWTGCILSSLGIACFFHFVWNRLKDLYSGLKLRRSGKMMMKDETLSEEVSK